MLSGVYIGSVALSSLPDETGFLIEPISRVLATLGPPSNVMRTDPCESNYIWRTADIRLEVGSGCIYQKAEGKDLMRTHGAYAVEVWGTHSDGAIGVTGRGLALGDPAAKMKRLYGTRCECGPYTNGTGTQNTHGQRYKSYARYQWDENIELDIDLDAQGRVVHILLMGDLE